MPRGALLKIAGSKGASRLRPDDDARLIEAVRARRELYDVTHPKYSDHSAKAAVWRKIGQQLKATPAACKTRWNSIRDNYRKSLMRRAAGRTVHSRSYKYTDMLAFMNKYFRSPDVNVYPEAEEEGKTGCTEEDFVQDKMTGYEEHSVTPQTHTAEPFFPIITTIKTEVEWDQENYAADQECLRSSSSTSSLAIKQALVDAVDAFLAGLSPTLKGMSPVHMSLAKEEIFAVVNKYEVMGLMEGDGWPANGYASP